MLMLPLLPLDLCRRGFTLPPAVNKEGVNQNGSSGSTPIFKLQSWHCPPLLATCIDSQKNERKPCVAAWVVVKVLTSEGWRWLPPLVGEPRPQPESQELLTMPSHSLLPRPTFLFTLPRLSFTAFLPQSVFDCEIHPQNQAQT